MPLLYDCWSPEMKKRKLILLTSVMLILTTSNLQNASSHDVVVARDDVRKQNNPVYKRKSVVSKESAVNNGGIMVTDRETSQDNTQSASGGTELHGLVNVDEDEEGAEDANIDPSRAENEPQSSESMDDLVPHSVGEEEPEIQRRGDLMAMKQMKMMMKMNKKQMMLQTMTNVIAMMMKKKMKMKKMKYQMKKAKMKYKYEEKKMKEKKKICKACKKGCKGGYGGSAEPELVKIDRIKLKKVPMPVEAKSYKKTAKGGKGGFKVANSHIRGGYSFPEPYVIGEPEILSLPEPEIYTKKQLVSYDYQYQQYPNQDYYGSNYGYDYPMPNMTDMMTTSTTTTTTTTTTMAPPTMRLLAAPQLFTFNPVAFNGGKKR